jgi:hypothetical protein
MMRGSMKFTNDHVPLYKNQDVVRGWFNEECRALRQATPLEDHVVVVHVRLGDTWRVKHDKYPQFPLQYWVSAIRSAAEGMRTKLSVHIVTDQHKHGFIQALVKALRATFSSSASDIQAHTGTLTSDWMTLFRARRVVSGCTTFAWWATFLSPHVRRMVVPEQGMFAPSYHIFPECDPRWTRLRTTWRWPCDCPEATRIQDVLQPEAADVVLSEEKSKPEKSAASTPTMPDMSTRNGWLECFKVLPSLSRGRVPPWSEEPSMIVPDSLIEDAHVVLEWGGGESTMHVPSTVRAWVCVDARRDVARYLTGLAASSKTHVVYADVTGGGTLSSLSALAPQHAPAFFMPALVGASQGWVPDTVIVQQHPWHVATIALSFALWPECRVLTRYEGCTVMSDVCHVTRPENEKGWICLRRLDAHHAAHTSLCWARWRAYISDTA